MSIEEIIAKFWGLGLIALLSLIQISPIKINPWSWLGKKIGNAINHDVMAELKIQGKKIDDITEDNADTCRQRILEFNDSLLHGEKHSKEYFDSILHTIDKYEDYCEKHKGYKNSIAELAIANIKEIYSKLSKKEGGFL